MLLFTLGVSVITGIVFGFAPIMHTRIAGLAAALKEGGARGATSSARHHVRRGLVVAEVALAVMLVIGAGLLLRTVYNLSSVDAGFDRSRLVTFAMTLPTVNYPQAPQRAQLYQRLLGRLRELPGVQGATAMSGLPPERQVDANDTDIENYTAPPEGPFENVDYYQSVATGYFETMGIPIVDGRAFTRADASPSNPVTVVNETMVRTFWKDQNPIGQRVRPGGAEHAVVHRHRRGQGREAGRPRQEDRHRALFPRRSNRQPRPRPGADHHEHRAADHDAAVGAVQAVESAVREADRSRAGRAPARHGRRCSTSRSAVRACSRSCSADSRGWRCCWPRSAPTASCPTW